MTDKTRVFGWSADQAGCAAYRIRWVADAINELYGDRIEYRYGTVMDPQDQEWADVVVGQRIVKRGPSLYWQKWAAEGTKKLVMEFDDDLWTLDESNRRGSAVFNNPETQRRMNQNVLVSDLVTVSTEKLRDAVHKNTGFPLERIIVIPNAVPESLLNSHQKPAETSLGWLASPTHGKDADMVQRHVRRLLEGDPNLTFHSIGMDYGVKMKLPSEQTKNSGWVRPPEEAIRKIDYAVGICPLVPSTFNLSKSDCKFLELAARGSAAIVSDVTAYSAVQDGVTGVKVRREHEWGRKLRDLVYDADMQAELRRNAFEYVVDHRTLNSTAPRWMEVFTQ